LAKDRAWRPENAGADDRADEKKQKITESECAEKWRHFRADTWLRANGPKAS
jgi:hypothetical protein